MASFVVTDDGVLDGIPFRKTNRGRFVIPLGDSAFINVSKRLASLCGDSKIKNCTPIVLGTNRLLLNSQDDPVWRERALVKLCITALPGRKRVSYDLPEEQVLMRAPMARAFGRRTHRWHEVLAWLNPGQTVLAKMDLVVREWTIEPFGIRFDGVAVTCEQRAAVLASPREIAP